METKYTEKKVEKLIPNPSYGLTNQQVKMLTEHGYGNDITNSPYKTTKQIIRDNTLTFFNLIFAILAICLLLVGSYKDTLFLAIVIINTLIGIVQQVRSKRVLDKMTIMSTPECNVIREGKTIRIKTNELVREDIVIFKSGNQIAADGKIIEGEVRVDESLLTGESDPIIKTCGDKLLSGSFILTGKCKAILEKVGANSYASKLTIEAKRNGRRQKSEMMESLDKLIKVIGFTLIPIGLLLFMKQLYVLNLTIEQSTITTVAALVGMIPEGLYLLTSVALAVSVMKLSRKKTLVNDMNCIETLARVDILCVDKTGTITEPKMKVEDIEVINKDYKKEEVEEIIGSIFKRIEADNSTAEAIKERYGSKKETQIIKRYPFLSSTKFEGATLSDNKTFVYGSPENIMKENYYKLEEDANKYIDKGYRVLLFARLEGEIENNRIEGRIIPICFILISNPIRKDAKETFEYFKEQGVQIKVISGDNPIMVSKISKEAGIDWYDKFIDASKLDDNELKEAVKNNSIFGRVTPSQKREIIKILKSQGHCVAMTGDGVNDILALRDADVGIAMASGSDAAGQASDLVLLDSNFSSMPKIVEEGRRVINNIERAASLFLVKNIFSFFLALISLIANIPYPFTPLQLSLISAITIGIPAFFLALETNNNLVKGKFITNVLSKAFPGGLTNLLILLAAQLLAFVYDLTNGELSTISTILMGTIGLIVLYNVSKPFEIKRFLIWSIMASSMILIIIFYGNFFSLYSLPLRGIVTLGTLMLLTYPAFKTIGFIVYRIIIIYNSLKRKLKRKAD